MANQVNFISVTFHQTHSKITWWLKYAIQNICGNLKAYGAKIDLKIRILNDCLGVCVANTYFAGGYHEVVTMSFGTQIKQMKRSRNMILVFAHNVVWGIFNNMQGQNLEFQ